VKVAISMLSIYWLILCGGCANPGPVQVSADTYLISRTDKGGIFGNESALQASVYADANKFAESKGKVVLPISTHATPLEVGRHFATFDYQFRLVDSDDPRVKTAILVQRPDVVVEQNSQSKVDVKTLDHSDKKNDLYTELLKLDDLRQRGIITDAEFEQQKAKLLNAN